MTRPFIMFFTERSGSSALMFDLDQHPEATVHMELFGEKTLPGGKPQTDDNRIALLHELWAGFHNPDWLTPEERGCARGFKMQFKRAGVQFDQPERLAPVLRAYDPVIIALRRGNVLRQAISKVRSLALAEINAREWGVPDQHIQLQSGPQARAFARQPIRIDPGQLHAALESIRLNQADMEAFLQLCAPTLEIAYEDYLADRLSALNPILEQLGLKPFAEAPMQTLMKITDDDWTSAVTNVEEVRSVAQARGLPF